MPLEAELRTTAYDRGSKRYDDGKSRGQKEEKEEKEEDISIEQAEKLGSEGYDNYHFDIQNVIEIDEFNLDDIDKTVQHNKKIHRVLRGWNEKARSKRKGIPVLVKNYKTDVVIRVKLLINLASGYGLLSKDWKTVRPLVTSTIDLGTSPPKVQIHPYNTQNPKEKFCSLLKSLMDEGWIYIDDNVIPAYMLNNFDEEDLRYEEFQYKYNTNRVTTFKSFFDYKSDLNDSTMVIVLKEELYKNLLQFIELCISSYDIKNFRVGPSVESVAEKLANVAPLFALSCVIWSFKYLTKAKGTKAVTGNLQVRIKMPGEIVRTLEDEDAKELFDSFSDESIEHLYKYLTPEVRCICDMLNYTKTDMRTKSVDEVARDRIRSGLFDD